MRVRASLLLVLLLPIACKSPEEHRKLADETAARIIEQKQKEALGRTEPFTVERPADALRRRLIESQGLPVVGDESLGTDRLKRIDKWPEDYPKLSDPATPPWEGPLPYILNLIGALEAGALNSREYQTRKENVFRTALDLDLARNNFRWIADGTADVTASADLAEGGSDGVTAGADVGVSRLLKTGALVAGSIGIDLVRLLTGAGGSSLGLFGDASIVVPLLRGAGRHVVLEPLTQAERNVVYALQDFDRFRRVFAVRVANEYFDVLRLLDRARNAEENYRNLVVLSRRTRALAVSGRLPGVQVDQARQDELRARDNWIGALQDYENRLDGLKQTLGLPTDARIELDRDDLASMAETVRSHFRAKEAEGVGGIETGEIPSADAAVELPPPDLAGRGRYELDEAEAVQLAFANRQDLKVARGRIFDAQRQVVVRADALRAGLTLSASALIGDGRTLDSATMPDARFDPTEGLYSASLLLDLPFERTAERNAYREAYLDLEQSVRDLQALEDSIKLDVRSALRQLLENRESAGIQVEAVRLARDRVTSTNLFLEAGRAQVRDVLDAQESLLSAQNALTEAFVSYRVAELAFQRDLGVLRVATTGTWTELSGDGNETQGG